MRSGEHKRGFTLIELLIVIAIIAILAAVVFVALDPIQRFQDSRDSARWQDVTAIVDAINLDRVDNGGEYLQEIEDLSDGIVYMIVDGNMDSGCDNNNADCETNVSGDALCVDLGGLIDQGYLPEIPISPSVEVNWDRGQSDGDEGTGYTLMTSSTGSVTVRSCESENSTEIYAVR